MFIPHFDQFLLRKNDTVRTSLAMTLCSMMPVNDAIVDNTFVNDAFVIEGIVNNVVVNNAFVNNIFFNGP